MAEGAFDVGIRDYRLGKRKFRANDRNPSLPMKLARNVQAVAGLSNLAVPRRNPVESDPWLLRRASGPTWNIQRLFVEHL